MKDIGARVAMVAFPASAIVIVSAAIVEGATSIDVSNEVSAACTGLLTYLGFILLGAGAKNGEKK